MSIDDRTPIIVGIGEASERIDSPDYAALSPADLAAAACRAALDDAGAPADLAPSVEVIAVIRQFEVSGPGAVAPFGKADNFPRAVAKRIGADPKRAILEPVGGQGPQHLVNEFAQAIGKGEMGLALICGSEAISTIRHLMTQGETRDWNETIGGELEDRGYGLEGLLSGDLASHGARQPIQLYAMFENARRDRLGLDRKAYGQVMGELFAPFTEVAATNPHAMSQERLSAEDIATVTGRNRLITDPFPRRVVARDQANQGAAVLLTSVGQARALGIPEEKWVYLHGGADTKERSPMDRQDLARYPAAGLASRKALEVAGLQASDIDIFDIYSCFPIAVFSVQEELGLAPDDKRPMTVTGGLPFFGGAGNNYSMHAIASMVRRLRAEPGKVGFVGANGGFLSKYSTGIYSTRPSDWKGFDSKALQAEIDAWPAPARSAEGVLSGVVESYTIDYGGKAPRGILLARDADGGRFPAMTDAEDSRIVSLMESAEPLGAHVETRLDDKGRRVVTALTPRDR